MFVRLALVLLTMSLCGSVSAGEGRKQLDHFMSAVSSLQASFQQTVYSENGAIKQEVSGDFYMQRPGKFRWDYTRPYEQVIVADGEKLWIYDKDLDQVTVRLQKQAIGDTPALLLGGKVDLTRNFTISEPAAMNPEQNTAPEGIHWVLLTPHQEESGFLALRIAFRGNRIAVMELDDNFGQKTVLEFSEVKENTPVEPGLFRFTPPQGVDLVDNTGG